MTAVAADRLVCYTEDVSAMTTTSETAVREAVREARESGNWKTVLDIVGRYEVQDKSDTDARRWSVMRGSVYNALRKNAAGEWLDLVEAAQRNVVARDDEYARALDTDGEAAAKKAYDAAKTTYRAVEREAFADGFHWTCGRCGGSGVWPGNGGTCFNCGGGGFHPTQSKHKFDASPKVRAKREAAFRAKQAAKDAAYEAALTAVGGRVEARLREVAEKGDAAMYDGNGWDDLDRDENFVFQLVEKLRKYGSLSEAQVAAVERGLARTEEREAELANTPPLEGGKRDLEGTVLSTKWQDGRFGSQFKMLVKLDDGNKVWGTVPTNLEQLTYNGDHYGVDGNWVFVPAALETLVDARVAFTATVERSRDDEHFGFFKRPTKARITTEVTA